MPQPFAGIARECLRRDPARRCTVSDVRARLEPARALPEPAGKSGNAVSGKLRIRAVLAAVFVLLAIVAALVVRSHQTEPSVPAAEEERSAPAIATSHSKPSAQFPRTSGSQAVAVKDGVVKQVMPEVLLNASASIRGQVNVRVRVAVDVEGNVSDASLDSPASSKYFAKVALQAARQWRFKPAQARGQAVSSVWILQFQFTQTGANVVPIQVSP
jgi:TonB family protein